MTEPRSVNTDDITDPQSFILRRENGRTLLELVKLLVSML